MSNHLKQNSVMRYVAGISYEGSHFHGWQKLKTGLPTIEKHIESALSYVANEQVQIFCAGRTDAGVHATEQIIHFDSSAIRSERNWVLGANKKLPASIATHWVKPVKEDFHARFSAISRQYVYLLLNQATKPALFFRNVTWHHRRFDVEKMQLGANWLIGEHDFNAYRAAQCQAKHAVRFVEELNVKRDGDLILISIKANAFLHHMVRNIVGVLMKIGWYEKSPKWAHEVLCSRDRRCAGITAPPNGLYLTQVDYPKSYRIPKNDSFASMYKIVKSIK